MRELRVAFTDDSFPEERNLGQDMLPREQIRVRHYRGALLRYDVRKAMEAKIRAAHERTLQRRLGPDWVLDRQGVPMYLPARDRAMAKRRKAADRAGMEPSIAAADRFEFDGEPLPDTVGRATVLVDESLSQLEGATPCPK